MTKKPILFDAACIFSILGSSIGFFSMFLAAIFFRLAVEKITQITNITATEHLNPFYFALLGVAFAISVIGAIKLFRMQKAGLIFYLAGQATIMFLPVIWMGSNSFSVINAIFTILFVGVYFFYFKILKN